MKKLLLLVMLIVSNCACAIVDNNSANIYQVEIIIFEHLAKITANNAEQWPIYSAIDTENAIIPEYIDQIDHEKLTQIQQKLATNKNYRVMLVTAWQQELPYNAKTPPILVQSGAIYGTLKITRRRNIKIEADLAFNKLIKQRLSRDRVASYRIKQTRYLAKGRKEVYYLDHPHFGCFIAVSQIERLLPVLPHSVPQLEKSE